MLVLERAPSLYYQKCRSRSNTLLVYCAKILMCFSQRACKEAAVSVTWCIYDAALEEVLGENRHKRFCLFFIYLYFSRILSPHLLHHVPLSPSFPFASHVPSLSSCSSPPSLPFPHNCHHFFFLLSSSVLYLSLLTGSVALRRFRLSNSSLSMKLLSTSSADSCQSLKQSEPKRQMSCTAFRDRTELSGRRTTTVGTSLTLNMACSSLKIRKTHTQLWHPYDEIS